MSKNISLSDDVYEDLVREKGDRSFSELIRDTLESGETLGDVTGQGILDDATYDEVKTDIGRSSELTEERLDR